MCGVSLSLSPSKQGAYYTQPVYAAQPHVIHHTTVVQPNSIPSALYPASVAAPRTNGVAMGMVAGTTMAMSAGKSGSPERFRFAVLLDPAGLHHRLPSCCRHTVGHPSARCSWSTSNLGANVQGPRHPCLQLRTSPLVISLANPRKWQRMFVLFSAFHDPGSRGCSRLQELSAGGTLLGKDRRIRGYLGSR